MTREESQAKFGEDYLRFLDHSAIRLEIAPYTEQNFDRVAELVQRTNQLNFSGRKYDRDQLRKVLDDPTAEKYLLSCSDKFGAYGLIGFGLARRGETAIAIHDFMLSCRVQGRLIEQAFFTHLERHHNPRGAQLFLVHFTETTRNQPARQALENAGLKRTPDGLYSRELRDEPRDSDIIRIECSAGCGCQSGLTKGDAPVHSVRI